jgi:uncharacterized protein YbaR (Trm112 family)/SAM-dependent methyltransferase
MNLSNITRIRRLFKWVYTYIPKGALVLEVGSGDKPFMRSDVLCDKYWHDNTERGGILFADRPCVIGALEELPFKSNSFDFIICHNLLEHVEDPAKCIEELMRVGRSGSIRTPSALAEKLLGPVYHRWLISLEGGKLIFERKESPVFDLDIKRFMKEKVLAGARYQKFFKTFRDDLEIQLIWNQKIPYHIHEEKGGPHSTTFRAASLTNPFNSHLWPKNHLMLTWKQKAMSLASWIVRRLHGARRVNLDALLACPVCKSDVLHVDEGLSCRKCRVLYPMRNAIPIMLREAAHPWKTNIGPKIGETGSEV